MSRIILTSILLVWITVVYTQANATAMTCELEHSKPTAHVFALRRMSADANALHMQTMKHYATYSQSVTEDSPLKSKQPTTFTTRLHRSYLTWQPRHPIITAVDYEHSQSTTSHRVKGTDSQVAKVQLHKRSSTTDAIQETSAFARLSYLEAVRATRRRPQTYESMHTKKTVIERVYHPLLHTQYAENIAARTQWMRHYYTRESSMYIPVRGDVPVYGEYYVELMLGTPPQNFTVQLDTGSADLVVNNVGCTGCLGRDYNFRLSNVAYPADCDDYECSQCTSNGQCQFIDEYDDGCKQEGVVFTDMLRFPHTSSVAAANYNATVDFGASLISTPDFQPAGIDGIFGLAYRELSAWQGESALVQYMAQNKLPHVFALCLDARAGDKFAIGYDAPPQIQWTSLLQDSYYIIQVNDLLVGNVPLGYNARTYAYAVVDTGATFMYLPQSTYITLMQYLRSLCKHVTLTGICNAPTNQTLFDGACFAMTDAELAVFPNLSVMIQGIDDLVIAPTQYLINYSNTWCWGIDYLEESSTIQMILGDVALQGRNVVFDVAQKRVGFGTLATCAM